MVENFMHLLTHRGLWVVLTLRDGYFAGAVFDDTGRTVHHKTFQRYEPNGACMHWKDLAN